MLPSIETTKGDVDGVPTVVIEAAISRLPIITTDAGGISELINQANGIIVPQRDAQAIADALIRLIADPELRKSLGQKAYAKAASMFDINVNVAELERLLL